MVSRVRSAPRSFSREGLPALSSIMRVREHAILSDGTAPRYNVRLKGSPDGVSATESEVECTLFAGSESCDGKRDWSATVLEMVNPVSCTW